MNKISISDLNTAGKRLFIRVDFNVPLNDESAITDDTRIREALPTIRFAREAGARLILASHMGRPKGKVLEGLRLGPAAKRLSELLGADVIMAPDCVGGEVERLVDSLEDSQVLLLENLRFHKGEEENDEGFSRKLASPAELYVNDAFGTAHRAHASTVGITRFLSPCAAGFLIEKEIKYFDKVISRPDRPFLALLGGAKISTKIPVIDNLIDKVDKLLIGGGMAFTFFKSQGMEIGKSLVEEEMVEQAGGFLERAHQSGKEILLPQDILAAEELSDDAPQQLVSADGIPSGWMGLDIGPATVERWSKEISGAGTIVWNGPMGAFEKESFSRGTVAIARAVADSGAVSIVGGGDSVAALDVAGVRDRISHVSTGGGASLDFLAGKTLPAIEALTDRD